MSSIHVKARFKDGVFVPEKPLLLAEDTEVLVVIEGGQAEVSAANIGIGDKRNLEALLEPLEAIPAAGGTAAAGDQGYCGLFHRYRSLLPPPRGQGLAGPRAPGKAPGKRRNP